jgi:GT2 family glycosyltransferase
VRVETVVTNFETWELTSRLVRRVAALEPDERVRVVDDRSTSSPPADLESAAIVERNPARWGLVRSLDAAIRRSTAELVVLFDSDACPVTAYRTRLAGAFGAEPKLAVVGFRTVDERGAATGSVEPEPGAASLVLGQRLHALARRLPRAGRGRISVYACAMAVRRSAYLELGGFDIGLDWLDLDHDLCMKAWAGGWTVRHDPELVAIHEGAGAPQSTEARVRRFYRSRWRLLRHHGRIRSPRLVRWLVVARLRAERAVLRGLAALPGPRREHWRRKLDGRRELIELIRSEWR